jgi:serine/threonine protein kinase
MGEVYRATDDRLGRDVAIKILQASLAKDSDRLRRFEQEARAAAALNHPNIVAVYDVGMHQGSPYIVSELLEGHTLRERLLRGPSHGGRQRISVYKSQMGWLPLMTSTSFIAISSRKIFSSPATAG